MKLTDFFVPLAVILLLTAGLQLPTYRGSYSKFSAEMLLCAAALVFVGASRILAALRPERGLPYTLRAVRGRLAVLVRAWPFRILAGLVALSLLSGLWAGSAEAWRWSVLFLITHFLWTILVYTWLRMRGPVPTGSKAMPPVGTGRGHENAVFGAYIISSVIAALVGMVIFVYELHVDPGLWGNPTHRLIHPLGNANFMAGFLIAPLLLSIAAAVKVVITSRTDTGISREILFAVPSVLLLAALWMTGSRGGMVGCGAGLFVLIVMHLKKRARNVTLASVAVMILIGALTVLAVPSLRGWATAKAYEGTNVVRTYLWGDAWRMIEERPILGWGAGGFSSFHATIKLPEEHLEYYLRRSAISPHNEFLEYGVDYGLLGMTLYLAFVLGLVWRALASARSGRWSLVQKVVLAAFIGLNVQSCFDVGLRVWDLAPFYWLMVGALFAFVDEKEQEMSASFESSYPWRMPRSLTVILSALGGVLGIAWCVVIAVDLVGQVQMLTATRAQDVRRCRLAAAYYNAALGKMLYFPDRVTAHLCLSECQQAEAERQIYEAIATLEDLKGHAPNERGTHLKLGLLNMQAADQLATSPAERAKLLNSALAALQTYLQTNTDPKGYLSLARVYLRQSPCRFGEAVAALQKYLELSGPKGSVFPPADAKTRVFSAKAAPASYLELAALWQAVGKKQEALDVLQTAAKRFPGERTIGDVLHEIQGQESKP